MALMSCQCEREHRPLQHVLCFLSLICLHGISDNGYKVEEASVSDFTSLRINVYFVSLPKATRGFPQLHNDLQECVLCSPFSTSGECPPRPPITPSLNHSLLTGAYQYRSRSRIYGQSVSMSWYRAPLRHLRPDITSCRNVAV
jgi:hypothetical protein